MNVVQITPGAGGMYCGNCFRDNALVRTLREMGHATTMIPLYLPMTLEERDESTGTPIFFSGINVYLEQVFPLWRHTPAWFRQWFTSPRLLKWASGRAAQTRASELGALTLSMLRGEAGHQARELDDLVRWLREHERPDIVCLSNALLLGLARRLRQTLGAPVICMLQGEDSFLDGLPESHRAECWRTLKERARDVDLFIAPSRYFGELMAARLELDRPRVRVIYNGINLDGFNEPVAGPRFQEGGEYAPVLGYFARMCPEKGLDTLVEAYLALKQRPGTRRAKLQVGGGCGPGDEDFVNRLKERLRAAGVAADVSWFPNVDRAGKLEFFRGLTVLSVPAVYGEAFGLYVIEALAAGVPVVQPRTASFPELIEATGGGLLCEPRDARALADTLEKLLLHPLHARELGRRGRAAVRERFSLDAMARQMVQVWEELRRPAAAAGAAVRAD